MSINNEYMILYIILRMVIFNDEMKEERQKEIKIRI